jgi:hypothetical protein
MEQEKTYDIVGYDFEDVIKINKLLNELDDIFEDGKKILLGGVEWKRCGIAQIMTLKF